MNKPVAKGDRCYCYNTSCEIDCLRKVNKWSFNDKNTVMYTFINKCKNYEGKLEESYE